MKSIKEKILKTLLLWIVLGICPCASAMKDEVLLPVSAEQPGWSFYDDIGWVYVQSASDNIVRFWVSDGNDSGEWYMVSEESYPFYYDYGTQRWFNINSSTIGDHQLYATTFEEDYLSGNAFISLEAFASAMGVGGVSIPMKPRVSFQEDGTFMLSYSDTVSFGIWTYHDGKVLSSSRVLGDLWRYNRFSEILLIEGRKYRRAGVE